MLNAYCLFWPIFDKFNFKICQWNPVHTFALFSLNIFRRILPSSTVLCEKNLQLDKVWRILMGLSELNISQLWPSWFFQGISYIQDWTFFCLFTFELYNSIDNSMCSGQPIFLVVLHLPSLPLFFLLKYLIKWPWDILNCDRNFIWFDLVQIMSPVQKSL